MAALFAVSPLAARAQLPGAVIPFPDVQCSPVGGPSVRSTAAAAISPFALVVAGNTCLDLSSLITPSAQGIYTLSLRDLVIGDAVRLDALSMTFDTDPFINFSTATTNLIAGTTTYSFLFGTPIVPGTYNSATSSISGSVTAGATAGTVANSGISPTFVTGFGTLGAAATDLGVSAGMGSCTTTTSANCPAAPQAGANTFSPQTFDNLEVLLTYDQSGLLSQATFSGRVDLSLATVPEPSSVVLLLTGALLLGAGRYATRRWV